MKNQVWVLMSVVVVLMMMIGVFYLVNYVLSCKEETMSKISCFESGFASVGKVQNSFSVHFFIIMLMFVIFDLEIVLLLGIVVSDLGSLVGVLIFMIFVVGGFYMEWFYGKLAWMV